MEFRRLANTGLKVRVLCFGMGNFMLSTSIPSGWSEEIPGNAVRRRRKNALISNKAAPQVVQKLHPRAGGEIVPAPAKDRLDLGQRVAGAATTSGLRTSTPWSTRGRISRRAVSCEQLANLAYFDVVSSP
jgi:aryl-alcohol dehydrogenase-like predicted oxidoreductase